MGSDWSEGWKHGVSTLADHWMLEIGPMMVEAMVVSSNRSSDGARVRQSGITSVSQICMRDGITSRKTSFTL